VFRSGAALVSAFALVGSLALGVAMLPTRAGASANYQAGNTNSITIPAGGSATLSVRGFCLDFGKPFPTQDTTIKGLADDKIRAALNYAIQKGYTEGNPQQVEQAMWFLRDNTWHNPDHTIGQEIVNNATTANMPQAGTGTAINDAVTQNKVAITAKFTAQTADHFYGDAQLQIRNTGTADIQLYLPIGTVFTVPNSNGAFQDLAAYALNAQPVQATTTVSPAVTASAVVTGTATVQTPTAAATAVATAATTPVETATTEPIATTAVETPLPDFTPTHTSGILPQAGAGDDSMGMIVWTLVLVALGLLSVGAGALAMHSRKL
jgi:hypothetical protein